MGLLLVLFSIASAIALAVWSVLRFEEGVRVLRLEGKPRLHWTTWVWSYPRALLSPLKAFFPRAFRAVSPLQIRIYHAGLDQALLASLTAVRDACGCSSRYNHTSFLYWHAWSSNVSMQLMTHTRFPFPLLGAVHKSSQVTAAAPELNPNGLYDCTVCTGASRSHHRGTEVDIIVEIRASISDPTQRGYVETGAAPPAVLWRQVNTLLFFRKLKTSGPFVPFEMKGYPEDHAWTGAAPARSTLALPASLGRQYAALNGDYNPIHLSALTANLFGFKQAIAHGMCVTDIAIPQLLAHHTTPHNYPLSLQVEFRKPVFLPSHPKLQILATQPQGTFFRIVDENEEACIRGKLFTSE